MTTARRIDRATPWRDAVAAFAARAPVPVQEVVALDAALGRTTFASLASRVDQPPADVSAVDGYAVRTLDLAAAAPDRPVRLTIVGQSDAGGPYTGVVGPGEAVRIATGAHVPRGSDGIVMHEDVPHHGPWGDLPAHLSFVAPATRKHVRRRGEDRATAETVVRGGVRLGPAQVAALAAAGVDRVPVARRPTVAIVTSGNELVSVGSAHGDGVTFDSAGPAVAAIAGAWGAAAVRAPIVSDDFVDWSRRWEAYAATGRWMGSDGLEVPVDVVVSIGGAARGPRDVVRRTLEEHADVVVSSVDVRPGGPTMIALVAGRPWLALPGTPGAAAVVGASMLGAWCAAATGDTQGGPDDRAVSFEAAHDVRALASKTALWWGTFVPTPHGWRVSTLPRQGSSRVASWGEADVLVRVEPGAPPAEGDPVAVLPLPGARSVEVPRRAP